MATSTPRITVAHGDGIGPEIMDATLRILEAAGADLEIDTIEIGESVYKQGHSAGITPESWDVLRRNRVLLKSPITTPRGGGYKSLNVTIRKTLGLFANVRPCTSYYPFIQTAHPHMNVVIVRENEEDLYSGIEHRQTADVTQCLKLISHSGSERIIRYAFEYARMNGRKKVTAMVKDNIMKITDGLFHQVFQDVAKDYPALEADAMIIDIGAARLADTPDMFDVIVTSNLYGDIISDIAAQITGSVGLGASANIGEHSAMFEAIHGSAPDIAGQNIANPSGLLLASVLMLKHIGQWETAERIQNAWLTTIEEGIHKHDIYREGVSKQKVGTKEFGQAVIHHLGELPKVLKPARRTSAQGDSIKLFRPTGPPKVDQKDLVGVDVFLDWNAGKPDQLGAILQELSTDALKLQLITNRGVKVWPDGMEETFCVDHWRCRFQPEDGSPIAHRDILALLAKVDEAGLDFIKTEHLYNFDGKPGFSLGQGQ